MTYYPDQRYASEYTVIRREVMLPELATGTIRIMEGKKVDVRDVAAQGVMPSRHIIIDAMPILGLKKPEELLGLMQVEPGDTVEDQDVLAGKNPKRGKRVFAPVRGIVAKVDNGRIILQEMPEILNLEAGVRGRVVRVEPGRGLVIEANGGQIQGVWGNNRRVISIMRMEPEGGLKNIEADDLDLRYKGVVVITQNPLTMSSFEVMHDRGFVGLIAPSMDISLMDVALSAHGAVFLTEGFGDMRMSRILFTMFEKFNEQQITLDAYMPNRWENRYPEIVINRTTREDSPPRRPNPLLALRPTMTVRVSREPYAGQTAKVVEIPKLPVQLENGLRVLCARVELSTGEVVFIPLNNLEVLGR